MLRQANNCLFTHCTFAHMDLHSHLFWDICGQKSTCSFSEFLFMENGLDDSETLEQKQWAKRGCTDLKGTAQYGW